MPQFGKSDKPVIKDEQLKFIADKLNAPAIASAIHDAIGVRVKSLPMTAENNSAGIKEFEIDAGCAISPEIA